MEAMIFAQRKIVIVDHDAIALGNAMLVQPAADVGTLVGPRRDSSYRRFPVVVEAREQSNSLQHGLDELWLEYAAPRADQHELGIHIIGERAQVLDGCLGYALLDQVQVGVWVLPNRVDLAAFHSSNWKKHAIDVQE